MGKELMAAGATRSPTPISSPNSRPNIKKQKPHGVALDKCHARPPTSQKRASYLADVLSDPGRRDRALGRREPARVSSEHQAAARAFACPLYKRFPALHMDCMSRKLTRIRDVKQHIHRRHSRSSYAAGDPHAISAETGRELKRHRAARTETAVTEWMNIWQILFRDEPPPGNPYLGTPVEETLQMLNDFWVCEGTHIMEQFLRDKGTGHGGPASDSVVHSNMSELLKVTHERFERSLETAVPMTPVGSPEEDDDVPSSPSLMNSQVLPSSTSMANSTSSSADWSSLPWLLGASQDSDLFGFGAQLGWPDGGPLEPWEERDAEWQIVEEAEGMASARNGSPRSGFCRYFVAG